MPASLSVLEELRSFQEAHRQYSTLHGINHVYVSASSTGRIDYDSERALQGFEGLKVRCSVHKPGEPAPKLSREVMLVDGVYQVNRALVEAGRKLPAWNDYPPELEAFYGRQLMVTSWHDLNTLIGGTWFVKRPFKSAFQPCIYRFPWRPTGGDDDDADLADHNALHLDDDERLLASEPVNFVAEWRAFVVCHKVVDVRQYRGDWRAHFDRFIVSAAADAFRHPSLSYAIDFGLTDDGRTLVVETNSGRSLGAYGLMPDLYATLLASGWTAAWGSE